MATGLTDRAWTVNNIVPLMDPRSPESSDDAEALDLTLLSYEFIVCCLPLVSSCPTVTATYEPGHKRCTGASGAIA
jgi:hypothetical protein